MFPKSFGLGLLTNSRLSFLLSLGVYTKWNPIMLRGLILLDSIYLLLSWSSMGLGISFTIYSSWHMNNKVGVIG